MSRFHRICFSLATAVIVSLACVLPAIPTPDAGAVNTAVAQTLNVEPTQNIPQETSTLTLTSIYTSTFTFTPTITLSPTLTVTPLPTFTFTPSVPIVSVSLATNCRTGPGKAYDLVGALLVGQFAEVFGRDPTSKYWYIRNPDGNPEFCWLWGQYATISGSPLNLPVLTPPPSPTPTATPTPVPSFDLKFNNSDKCKGKGWWVDVLVKNTGSFSFKSSTFRIYDTVTEVEKVALRDGFTNKDGCLKVITKDTISPGDSFIISSPLFGYNINGHNMRVFLKLCTEVGQNGGCITKRINVKP